MKYYNCKCGILLNFSRVKVGTGIKLWGLPRWFSGKELPAYAGDTGPQVRPLNQTDPLEEEMTTCSSVLAWKTPWTEEPGGLQVMGS